jgi:hypothetical protein
MPSEVKLSSTAEEGLRRDRSPAGAAIGGVLKCGIERTMLRRIRDGVQARLTAGSIEAPRPLDIAHR